MGARVAAATDDSEEEAAPIDDSEEQQDFLFRKHNYGHTSQRPASMMWRPSSLRYHAQAARKLL